MTTEKKKYHDKTTAHKDVQHPHSKLKSQKELRKITDSKEFKEVSQNNLKEIE